MDKGAGRELSKTRCRLSANTVGGSLFRDGGKNCSIGSIGSKREDRVSALLGSDEGGASPVGEALSRSKQGTKFGESSTLRIQAFLKIPSGACCRALCTYRFVTIQLTPRGPNSALKVLTYTLLVPTLPRGNAGGAAPAARTGRKIGRCYRLGARERPGLHSHAERP